MDKIKNDWKKWMYYFLLGLAIIITYHIFNNFTSVMGVLGSFFEIIAPFFGGVFMHEMHLNHEPFLAIKTGTKTIEL